MRTGSRASSARFETVSMPVYAIIATGIASRKFAPRRRDAEVDVGRERRAAEDEDEADRDEQKLRGEVDDGEQDVEPRRLLDADDVHEPTRTTITTMPTTMSHGFCRSGAQKTDR